MSQAYRLAAGGAIDRGKPLRFTFDGKAYEGFAGDTLASALLANGVRLVARSFKYHRPRGIFSAGPEEPNALVTIGSGARADPNTLATTTWLHDGLNVFSQNSWPSLRFDALSANALLAPFFVAGFYYKTFKWPSWAWEKLYEPAIRRAAGIGKLSGEPDPSEYDASHAFCDLLVIGAGPAGLSAALNAARAGLRVVLIEQDRALGGRLLSERHEIDGAPATRWAEAAEAELRSLPNVRLLTNTSAFAVCDQGEYAALERIENGVARARLWRIATKRALLATGATERPLVFGGNDTPGVMLASAAQTYAQRFAVRVGARAVVFTSTDSGWRAAADLRASGVALAAVIDTRFTKPPVDLPGVPVFLGGHVAGTRGGVALKAVEARAANGATHVIAADALAVSGGWTPNNGIAAHLGARPRWDDAAGALLFDAPPPGLSIIGAARAQWSLAAALRDGVEAGKQATADLGRSPAAAEAPRASDDSVAATPLWRVTETRGKAFVDLNNDVTTSDMELAVREGFATIEHLKRYTTLGMGTDQGRTSNINALGILAELKNEPVGASGVVLSRPPYTPVPIGAFAGAHRDEHFRPKRLTPSHDWAAARGAVFVETGDWLRAQWYPQPGETDWLTSVDREVSAVRAGVGACDVSTLGKIEVQGPDAAALLDRVYANTISTLAPGRARYGLMLREDGFALDDGTVTRFAADRFFITTTTANAGRVMQHLDFARQVLWPALDAQAVSVTEQWAQFSIAGPQARALLQKLLPHADLSNDAFPYMAAMQTNWCGAPARVYRLSFSGELAYEIGAPACYGAALIEALFAAGAAFGVTPYGTEALGVMRIEKGHPAGNEFNGQTTAHDLGLGRLLAQRKDYVGRVLARRTVLTDPARPTLVGIKPVNRELRLRAGAHILPLGAPPRAAYDEGYVTSVAHSPSLGHWIGLALVKSGPARHGQRVRAYDPVRSGDVIVEICDPVFIDPEGARLRG